jgi:hypothetical protein
MSAIRLDTADATELTELLQFVKEWLTADNEARASFARFVGSPGYDADDLCTDMERPRGHPFHSDRCAAIRGGAFATSRESNPAGL